MTCPEVSAPCAWKTCFAISNPIVLTSDTGVSLKWCYQHLHFGTPMPSRGRPPHQNLKKRLEEKNIPYSDYGQWAMNGWYQIFFYDPAGNVIEVHQDINE
jgi:hypothetical protein